MFSLPKQKTFWIGVALLAATAVGGWAGSAHAIEYGGIGGRPTNPDPKVPRSDSIFIYDLAGGSQKSDAITLINNTQQDKTLLVYPTDAVISSGGALGCRQQVEDRNEVGQWITLSQSEVSLGPLSSQTVPFEVSVPADASPGEHNGCIAIQEKDQTPQTGSRGIALTTRTALRVQITVPGDIKREVRVTGHTVKQTPKGGYLDHVTVKNSGNVSVETDVKTTVRYLFWVAQSHAGGTFSILPKVEADYNFDIKKPFWGLFYVSQAQASYKKDPASGQLTTTTGPTRVFWVTPEPLAGLIELLVLAGLIGGALRLRRRRRQRKTLSDLKSYQVKRGETLAGLAKRYGVSVKLLAKANAVTPDYQLKARQRIKVPATAGTVEKPAATPRSKAQVKPKPKRRTPRRTKKPAARRKAASKSPRKARRR